MAPPQASCSCEGRCGCVCVGGGGWVFGGRGRSQGEGECAIVRCKGIRGHKVEWGVGGGLKGGYATMLRVPHTDSSVGLR